MSVKVTLRKLKLKDGNYSLFLDITGSGRKKEYLGYKIYAKPKDHVQRTHNQNYLGLAQNIAAKRQLELASGLHFEKNNSSTLFLPYYESFIEKQFNLGRCVKNIKASLKNFREFLRLRGQLKITGKDITPLLCEDFAEYLAANFRGETPASYFRKFRQVLRRAFKERIVTVISADLQVKCISYDKDAIRKPLLSPDEINKLYLAPCPNDVVKRAFIFSLNTGLDFATIHTLKWSAVGDGYIIFDRTKSDNQNHLPLNDRAKVQLGERGGDNDLVFPLPSYQGCKKNLTSWRLAAGVKHFTWHSARHSLAVNLINEYGVDVSVVQSILGHKNIKTTMRYAKVMKQAKANALNRL